MLDRLLSDGNILIWSVEGDNQLGVEYLPPFANQLFVLDATNTTLFLWGEMSSDVNDRLQTLFKQLTSRS